MKLLLCCFAFFVVVYQTFQEGAALECYACSESMNKSHNCEVNLTGVNKEQCNSGFVCTLFIEQINNESVIHRLCHQPNICELLEKSNSTHAMGLKSISYCTSCNTSLCNVGSFGNSYIFNSSWITVILSVILMGIFNLSCTKRV